MLANKKKNWVLLLAIGELILSASFLLRHLPSGPAKVPDALIGFCMGLGLALIISSLVVAKRGTLLTSGSS